ncbi:hypothetical protein Clacol_006444 [Clathrus columnatus]|uniref:Galectin n=1 Tax=Clathrus columnatus TaxID=1419009 RepID=A0AAV5AGE4_9AGAM|nr:hypothetical protein Clacol_006444 [Clathrus columnatus]
MSEIQFKSRELFGGAITFNIPENFIDVSFHFDALAEDNSARSSHVFEITSWNELPRQSTDITPRPIILRGQQDVQKFNKSTSDNISISLALFRIESKNVDIVISTNAPGSLESSKVPSIFAEAISSFKIRDLGLFVNTEQMTDD